MRFNKVVRHLITNIFILGMLLTLPVTSYIPALTFSQVSGFNIHLINAIILAVCIGYTMLGGIKAVIWTDVVQAAVMGLSVILVIVFSVHKLGGVGEVIDRATAGGRLSNFNYSFDLTTRQTFWNVMIGYTCSFTKFITVNQSVVQRIVSLPSIKEARRSLYIFTFCIITLIGLNFATGFIMFANYYDCDPIKAGIINKADKLVPQFVKETMGNFTGMSGIFISAVFSASMSTMSANTNSLAGIIYNDYIKKIKWLSHTEENAHLYMKSIVFLIGIYCIIMGFGIDRYNSIYQLNNTISFPMAGALVGIFFLGLFVPRAHSKAVICSTIASIVAVAWIAIGANTSQRRVYEPLPTSTTGCSANYFNITDQLITKPVESPYDSFSIYHISFFWYAPIGFSINVIIGVILSYILKDPCEKKPFSPSLLIPFISKLSSKNMQHESIKTFDDFNGEMEEFKERKQTKSNNLYEE